MQILSNLGVDFDGPFFLLDDLDTGARELVRPCGQTFTLVKHPDRHCVGSYDLMTQERAFCKNRQELPADYKDTSCPACKDLTGFNPSFYNGGGITVQQRAYNDTPHIVYLAYFAPTHLKVGITSDRRGLLRLLEQGARSAMILKECASAYEARDWEAKLCSIPGIYESVRASEKLRLLTGERRDHAEAARLMEDAVRTRFGLEPTEALDLDRYYACDPAVFSDTISVPENPSDSQVAGECVGMVGSIALMRQQDRVFAVPLKDYMAHRVEYLPGKVLHEYSAPPEQTSLF